VDTGYFVFFVRKHDNGQKAIVLRSNKMLATSQMSHIAEDRIQSPKEIYDILHKFGICYVVLEELRFKSRALEWLKQEVKSDKFLLRKRIPITSNHPKLDGVSLAIYEYRGFTKASGDAVLQMNIPLMGDSIRVPFKDLLKP
jgi:hypothetical protein